MLSLEAAARCIKNVISNASCWICDKLEGDRVRYACGHVSCSNCVNVGCAVCLSQSDTSHVADPVATQQAKQALQLLKTFQDAFKIDVIPYLRRSEQLKKEKEIFKYCIQAPAIYSNTRKSTVFSPKKNNYKENTSLRLPGENISIMEPKLTESNKFVQEWLNKNEKVYKRIPFQELEVNTSLLDTRQKTFSLNKTKALSIGKRSHSIAFPSKKEATKSANKKQKLEGLLTKYVTDESGIVIDEDDNNAITIHDTQSEIMDKDKLALLAVLNAYEQENQNLKAKTNTNRITEEHSTFLMEDMETAYKEKEIKTVGTTVPFYKRGSLQETCKDCKNLKVKNADLEDVCITIENSSHKVTLTVRTLPSSLQKGLKDCSAQTNNEIENFKINLKYDDEAVNRDLSVIDAKNNTRQQLVIEESDSEEENSKNVAGILTELDPKDLQNRTLRGAPNISPTSTNSSEKENYNPNKNKFKSGKTTKKKKLTF